MSRTDRFEPTAEERALLERAVEPVLDDIREDRDRCRRHVQSMLDHLLDLEHLTQPGLTVTQWRKACGIRNKLVTTHFHQETGLPPRRYLMLRRVELAKRILEGSELAAWQIASLLGFSSPQSFGTSFKRLVGDSPQRYRIQQRILAEIADRKSFE
jgi:AraC-like DNA-binding protein